jgi:cytochrome c
MIRKIVALIPVAALAVACGGGETPEAKAPDEAAAAPEAPAAEAPAADAPAADGAAAPAEGEKPAEEPAK